MPDEVKSLGMHAALWGHLDSQADYGIVELTSDNPKAMNGKSNRPKR